MPSMKLTEDQKLFILASFAMFERPQRICDKLKEEYGIDVDRSHVQYYNPQSVAGRKLKQKYKDYYEDAREAFRAGRFVIAIAEKEARLRMLDDIAEEARNAGNHKMALRAIEQAAREQGDSYTNKTQSTINGEMGYYTLQGGLPDAPLGEVPPEQHEALMAEARQPQRHEIKSNMEEPGIDASLVEEDQLLANATPLDRAMWESRQAAKREAELHSIATQPSIDQP